MEPFQEYTAAFCRGRWVIAICPERRDKFGFARFGRAVNVLQSRFTFILFALHFERVEKVLM